MDLLVAAVIPLGVLNLHQRQSVDGLNFPTKGDIQSTLPTHYHTFPRVSLNPSSHIVRFTRAKNLRQTTLSKSNQQAQPWQATIKMNGMFDMLHI